MGVAFRIKKIDVHDYLEGSKVMLKTFDTYVTKDEQKVKDNAQVPESKAKAHMVDVLMAGIVSPALSRKGPEEGKIWVEHLFTEPDLVIGIYQSILEFTFGKKKLRAASRRTSLSKSTA